jgi:hypothetical protein
VKTGPVTDIDYRQRKAAHAKAVARLVTGSDDGLPDVWPAGGIVRKSPTNHRGGRQPVPVEVVGVGVFPSSDAAAAWLRSQGNHRAQGANLRYAMCNRGGMAYGFTFRRVSAAVVRAGAISFFPDSQPAYKKTAGVTQ